MDNKLERLPKPIIYFMIVDRAMPAGILCTVALNGTIVARQVIEDYAQYREAIDVLDIDGLRVLLETSPSERFSYIRSLPIM